ncbi:penicillin-binding protein 1A [Acidovorax sp. 107]|uniref:penicillin-binding protein 1A n=1 Tax=Acidovorax sp. 107 TaxID=2135638 RepID=UPI000D34C8B8|nr:PBP1A family penicillin-binding protein [Acidovorax sp. 107]PUA98583.1 penicillin-binding protein 1A [Acidovorax sp. 107]
MPSSSPSVAAPSGALHPKRSALKFLCGFLVGLVLAGGSGGAWVLHLLWQQLPTVDHLADYDPMRPLRIFARDGSLLAEFGEERREVVPIGDIPLHVRQALLAIEDARFYEHGAVDFTGLARAALRNVVSGEHAQGASTITMQVARVFFLSRVKTYSRKLMEILLAYKLEATYSKDKILELYMNQIYLGERAYGFAAAASVYFDKTLDELTVAEAAMLAGLPKAPSAYNPVVNRERATVRQQYILQRMHALSYLDTAAYDAASAEVLTLRTQTRSIDPAAAFAVGQARKTVVAHFGDDAYALGLDVVTTLSVADQRAATQALRAGLLRAQEAQGYAGPEAWVAARVPAGHRREVRAALAPFPDSGELRTALVREASPAQGITAVLRDGTGVQIPRSRLSAGARAALSPTASPGRRIAPGAVIRVVADARQQWRLAQLPGMEGALVSLDADTGEILALAGGFDHALNQFDHAVQALRQPGSTFKPFIFSAALEKGYAPGTLVDDAQRVVTPAARGRAAWSPRNYGGNYEGFISARRGLVRSKNMVAVNLMEAAGVQYVQQFAARFGFDPALNPPRLPLALGAGAVTPLQLTQAYAVFANGGTLVQPRLIRSVSKRGGAVLYAADGPSPRATVVSERNAFVLDSLLRDVVEHGTGRRAKALGRPDVAGKTGTSNDARDVWFAGYSSGVVSVVWMGYDQPRSLGRQTGGTLALPVWTEYMAVAVQGRQPVLRTMPLDLMRFGDDYLYPEYVFGTCVDDRTDFVQSPFECGLTGRRPPAEGALDFG